MSPSHIAMFERGEVLPRWKTAGRLADALELAPEEREEFYRVIDAAGKPRAVREATTISPIPGLAVWQHLPRLLYEIPHGDPRTVFLAPDRALVDAVRAAGSLLAWITLTQRNLSTAQRTELRDLAARTGEGADSFAPQLEEYGYAGNRAATVLVSMSLPYLWRHLLFRNRRTTSVQVRLLSRWDYCARLQIGSHERLSFRFKQRELDRKYNVVSIEPHAIAFLHDAMALHRLWQNLDLNAVFGSPVYNWHLDHVDVTENVKWLIHRESGQFKRELTEALAKGQDPVTVGRLGYAAFCRARNDARFTERLFEIPDLAQQVFGLGWKRVRQKITEKCRQLDPLLREVEGKLDPPLVAFWSGRTR